MRAHGKLPPAEAPDAAAAGNGVPADTRSAVA